MAHRDWCGRDCGECENPCALDESMLCGPNCENLSPDGEPDPVKCKGCDAYKEYCIMFDIEEEEDEEPSDAEQACELIDEIYQIVRKLNIDEDVKKTIKDKLYEITTHLDM